MEMEVNKSKTVFREEKEWIFEADTIPKVRISGRNQHLSWIIYEDHIVMF